MKKVLAGCLIAAVVLIVGIGLAGYYLVWKPAAQVVSVVSETARETIGKVGAMTATIEAMQKLESNIVLQGDYSAPAEAVLTDTQIARFLAVNNAVATALGPELRRIGDAVPAPTDSGNPALEWRLALEALTKLGDVGIAAKTAQIDALNAQQLSLAEYRWIRDTGVEALIAGGVLTAAGEAKEAIASAEQARDAARVAIEAARDAARDVAGGATPESAREPGPTPPADPAAPGFVTGSFDTEAARSNFERARPHAEDFVQSRMLSAFGL
jgi:hypothetical protein